MDDYELMLQLQQEDAMRDDVPEPGAPHVRMAAVTALYDQELEPEQQRPLPSAWLPEQRESWLVQWRYIDPIMDNGWVDMATCPTRTEALGILMSAGMDASIAKELRIALYTTKLVPVAIS
jgi:hypothetical protein